MFGAVRSIKKKRGETWASVSALTRSMRAHKKCTVLTRDDIGVIGTIKPVPRRAECYPPREDGLLRPAWSGFCVQLDAGLAQVA